MTTTVGTRNFTRKELQCPCCNEANMSPILMTKLQALRDELGIPLTVTSAYRCEKHNHSTKVRGASKSYHLAGKAVDVATHGFDGLRRYQIMKTATNMGFLGIGIYPRHMHLDIRTTPWLGIFH